jgi:hypothetical protein
MTKFIQTPNGPRIFPLIRAVVFVGIQILIAFQNLLTAQVTLETSDLPETVELAGQTHHVQGIEIEGQQLWVTVRR